MSRKVHGIATTYLTTIFSRYSNLQANQTCFSVKAIPWQNTPLGLDPNKDMRVTFITGKKKLGKLAVYRNRAERRIKASVSTQFLDIAPKGHDYIFYVNPPAVMTPWQDLQDQVQKSASKLQSLVRNPPRKASKLPKKSIA